MERWGMVPRLTKPGFSPWPPFHSREVSSSLAALAARSSPVGSKLLHLSLGRLPSPAPSAEPPPGGGGRGGGPSPAAGSPAPPPPPRFSPKSHDMTSRGAQPAERQAPATHAEPAPPAARRRRPTPSGCLTPSLEEFPISPFCGRVN